MRTTHRFLSVSYPFSPNLNEVEQLDLRLICNGCDTGLLRLNPSSNCRTL